MADAPFPSAESSETVEIRSVQPLAPDPVESPIGESLDEVIPQSGKFIAADSRVGRLGRQPRCVTKLLLQNGP